MELLFGLRDRDGATLVLVTHSPELVARCDRVVGLRDGRIDSGGDGARLDGRSRPRPPSATPGEVDVAEREAETGRTRPVRPQ